MASPDKTPLETPAHELVERGRAYLDLYRKWEAAEAEVVPLREALQEAHYVLTLYRANKENPLYDKLADEALAMVASPDKPPTP